MNHSLVLGKELDQDFNGYSVKLFKTKEGSYFIKCKNVFFAYSDYLSYLKNPSKTTLGYNLEGKPCKIKNVNGLVTVGCLKDTEDNFKRIVKQVKTIIQNDNKDE